MWSILGKQISKLANVKISKCENALIFNALIFNALIF